MSHLKKKEQGVCIHSVSDFIYARNANNAYKHHITILPGHLRQCLDKTRLESHQACQSVTVNMITGKWQMKFDTGKFRSRLWTDSTESPK